MSDRIARKLRVREGAARGIRAVPANPGPEFKPVEFACDLRPLRCEECRMACPHMSADGKRGWGVK